MSDNVSNLAEAALRSAASAPSPNAADAVFRAMHGFYGALWLSKFATGQTGADGADAGVVGAKAIWAHGLREFDGATVRAALRQCLDAHAEFPPSLPQFVQLCRANTPRASFKPTIDMSGELVAERNKAAREKLREMRQSLRRQSAVRQGEGLALLFSAIADAAGCAGGDASAELLRLERMFA